jgi:hypothetical protein
MPTSNELPPQPTTEVSPEELAKREAAIKSLDELERRLNERLKEKSEDLNEDNEGCCDNGCGCEEQISLPVEDEVIMSSPIVWDELKDNSVLVLKIDATNPARFAQFQHALVTSLLKPRMEILKAKKISVVFMGKDDDLSVVDEAEMGRLGWYKKEKSLIINPNESRR